MELLLLVPTPLPGTDGKSGHTGHYVSESRDLLIDNEGNGPRTDLLDGSRQDISNFPELILFPADT